MKTLTRRGFLKNAALLGAGAMTWGALPSLARAAASNTKVLFLNLNGGLDGLAALQPTSGSLYTTLAGLRPTLALSPGSLLAAANGFGFHPQLGLLKSLFDNDELSVVLNVGYKNMSRSHLDSEVVMARGVPDRLNNSSSGFLNRLGAQYGWSSLRAMSVTGTDLAFEGGAFRGVQVESLEDFYFRDFAGSSEREHLVAAAYSMSEDTLAQPGKPTFSDWSSNMKLAANNVDIIRDAVQNYTPSTAYPHTYFGRALKDIDTIFSAPELNTQVGYMRMSGFDSHSDQANTLNDLLSEVNSALSAFVSSMKSKGMWNDLIILVYSEFGRTSAENGSIGTDHGGANPVFLAGGAVRGGDIHGSLIASDLTDNGWLQMKCNIVEVYRRIVEKLGLDPDSVFAPNDGFSLQGIFR